MTFGYGRSTPIIEDLNIEVAPGTLHTVVGPSGCGKTTLLRLIAGLERARQGKIYVNGRQVVGEQLHLQPERRNVGFVFQDCALFPHLTAERNVSFGIRGRRRRDRRMIASRLLDRFGLTDHTDAMPHTLSGGQLQRVAIARSLARNPTVMLFDEPFCNLEVSQRAAIRRDIFEALKADSIATVLVTHDPDEVTEYEDDRTDLS
ncbi:MAG: ATP-binding cassette domain-containing protein [Myxococcota bacterium]